MSVSNSTGSMHYISTIFDGFVKLERWEVPGVAFTHVLARTSDSVVSLLVDRTNERALLVAQNRPAMVREDNPSGRIVECIGGRFDVNLSPKALLVKEAKEEAGVVITEDDVELLNGGVPVALSAGVLTERSYLAYAEITPDKLTGTDEEIRGAEGEGEAIGRVWIRFEDLETMAFEDARVMILVQHFLLRIARDLFNKLSDSFIRLQLTNWGDTYKPHRKMD